MLMKRIAVEEQVVPSATEAQAAPDLLSPMIAVAKKELEDNLEVRDYNPCVYKTGLHAGPLFSI